MSDPRLALRAVAAQLARLGQSWALVGGMAVAVRGEPRFTRDVDVAVAVPDDAAFEQLVRGMVGAGYQVSAVLEREPSRRLATVRVVSAEGVIVDLLGASCGIEPEVVARATTVDVPAIGVIPVARAEELLAMKVLSHREGREHDRRDAIGLIRLNPGLDLAAVRENLHRICERGFARGRDLHARLADLVAAADA